MAAHESDAQRIDYLARPKGYHPDFVLDRRSVYWLDSPPPRPGPNGTTSFNGTPRLEELAHHRPLNKNYLFDLETPVWKVPLAVRAYEATDRIRQLAEPKPVVPSFQPERSPYMTTTEAARAATASGRLQQLSRPKARPDISRFGKYEEEWGEWIPVALPALKANPSERTERLALHKGYHNDFQPHRPIQWPVTDTAIKAIASLRLQQLARPRSRTMLKDDYDPYKVSAAARKARATPRVEELSNPLPRKVQSKK